jgi:hypothetical protein
MGHELALLTFEKCKVCGDAANKKGDTMGNVNSAVWVSANKCFQMVFCNGDHMCSKHRAILKTFQRKHAAEPKLRKFVWKDIGLMSGTGLLEHFERLGISIVMSSRHLHENYEVERSQKAKSQIVSFLSAPIAQSNKQSRRLDDMPVLKPDANAVADTTVVMSVYFRCAGETNACTGRCGGSIVKWWDKDYACICASASKAKHSECTVEWKFEVSAEELKCGHLFLRAEVPGHGDTVAKQLVPFLSTMQKDFIDLLRVTVRSTPGDLENAMTSNSKAVQPVLGSAPPTALIANRVRRADQVSSPVPLRVFAHFTRAFD